MVSARRTWAGAAASAWAMRARIASGKAARSPMKATRHAAAMQFVHFGVEQAQEQLHQRAHFLLRPVPVLAGEGE